MLYVSHSTTCLEPRDTSLTPRIELCSVTPWALLMTSSWSTVFFRSTWLPTTQWQLSRVCRNYNAWRWSKNVIQLYYVAVSLRKSSYGAYKRYYLSIVVSGPGRKYSLYLKVPTSPYDMLSIPDHSSISLAGLAAARLGIHTPRPVLWCLFL